MGSHADAGKRKIQGFVRVYPEIGLFARITNIFCRL